jgi:hypothetical protein
MAHRLTPAQLQDGSHHHAARAMALLLEADDELAKASPASVPARVTHRVAAANAHALTAMALAGLIVDLPPAAPAG